jgi:hypothetical protein
VNGSETPERGLVVRSLRLRTLHRRGLVVRSPSKHRTFDLIHQPLPFFDLYSFYMSVTHAASSWLRVSFLAHKHWLTLFDSEGSCATKARPGDDCQIERHGHHV